MNSKDLGNWNRGQSGIFAFGVLDCTCRVSRWYLYVTIQRLIIVQVDGVRSENVFKARSGPSGFLDANGFSDCLIP
jgi:hypothetical protein